MKTLAAINQKGGVGKTTIALATAQGLAERGYKVLFIDLDAQQNGSTTLGVKGRKPTSLEILLGDATLEQAAAQVSDNLDAIAADPGANRADVVLDGIGKEYRLKEALEALEIRYDYCVIDTPPALSILTVNALTAANGAIVPTQADIYSLEGVGQLASTIQGVQRYSNPELKLTGFLLTRFNTRASLSREVQSMLEQAAEALDTKVFNATIREGVAIKEAQAAKQSIFDYAPKAKVTNDLNEYLDELIGRL